MKKKKLLIAVGVTLLLSCISIILLNLQRGGDSGSVKIGVMLPLTGENSTFGNPIREGMMLAIEEEDGQRFRFEIQDSQNKQVRSINILHEYIDVKHMKFVVGDVSSSSTVSMVPIADSNGVFLFSPCAQTPLLTNVSPLFARCYPSTTAESKETAEFVAKNFKGKRIAVYYVNDDYGSLLAGDFRKELSTYGEEIYLFEAFDPQQKDFKGIVAKIADTKPEVIYLAGNPQSMGAFMRQYATCGYVCQIISDLAFLEHDCIDQAGNSAEGAIVPITYYNPEDESLTGSYAFGKKYKARYGKLPSIANAVGYDTIKLLVEAIEAEPSHDPLKVAAHIRNRKGYNGALGMLDFTNGDVRIPIVFKKIVNGTAVSIAK